MIKNFIGGLLAAFLVLCAGVMPAQAQNPNTPPQTFAERLGYVEVAPGLYFTEDQQAQLVQFGCTAGPHGLVRALTQRAVARGEMCGREYISRLDDVFKSGAEGWLAHATPLGIRLTIYSQAVNLNLNIRCIADVPYSGITVIAYNCVNSANGATLWSGTLSQMAVQTTGSVMGALSTHIAAPAGPGVIVNQAQSTSQGVVTTATGGAGGNGGNASSGSSSTAGVNWGCAGSPTCNGGH